MPAIIISPKSTDVSQELVNRFSVKNMLLLSESPMGADLLGEDSERWFRLPSNVDDSIDQGYVDKIVNTIISKIVEDSLSISAFFLFPNKSSGMSFLTTNYSSLLSAYSSNVVVPIALIMAVLEYTASRDPELPVYVFNEEFSGYEAKSCAAGLSKSLQACRENDPSGESHRLSIRSVDCSGTEFSTRFDVLCEKEFKGKFGARV